MKHFKKYFPILVLAAFGLAVAGYLTLFHTSGGARERSLQIIVGNFVEAKVYELSRGMLSEVLSSSNNNITSRFREPSSDVVVSIFKKSDEVGNTIIYEDKSGSKFLDAPFGIKDTPTLSSDASLIAYSFLTLPFGVLFSDTVHDWHVHVLDVKTGKDTDLGVGYGPHFVSSDPNVLMYSTPEGIDVVDVSTNTHTLFKDRTVAYVNHAAYASPDGAYVALYNDLTKRYSIFEITNAASFELNALGEIPKSFDVIALSNEYLYGVERDSQTNIATLWKYTLKDVPFRGMGELLYTFEDGSVPYQIVP